MSACNIKIGSIIRRGETSLELRCGQPINGDGDSVYCNQCHAGRFVRPRTVVDFSEEDVARAVEETKREEAQSLEWERINRPEVYAAIQAANARYALEYSDSEIN